MSGNSLVLARFASALRHRLDAVISVIFQRFPQGPSHGFCIDGFDEARPTSRQQGDGAPFSLKDMLGEGFLWAVPKHRRTLEKRWKRKFGWPEMIEKILRPSSQIRTCAQCGGDHLAGVLCPTCYKKVMDETTAMQEKIQEELKLEPVEKEVVVLYEGEKNAKPDEFWQGKRVVEMEKPRPPWFSKNLMQQTIQQPATTGDVKPSDLG